MAKISIQLSDDQHTRFVNAKMRRKESLQALMITATEQLLSGDSSRTVCGTTLTKEAPDDPAQRAYDKNKMEQSPIPLAHLRAHALLDQILSSGDPKAIEWISGNLKMFAEALEARDAAPPEPKPKG